MAEVCRTQAKVPDDFARGVNLNDPIVELVGYQSVLVRIEFAFLRYG